MSCDKRLLHCDESFIHTEQAISFSNARGDRLAGVLHAPAAKGDQCGAAILCHGMDSDKNSAKLIFLSRALAEVGVATLRFDFSYVGASSGKYEDLTCSGEVDDLCAYELMQQRYPGKLGIFGSSLGGTVALLFAAQQPKVAALATLAAPLHPEEFPKRMLTPPQLQQWREEGLTYYNGRQLNRTLLEDLEKIDVVAAAKSIRCPVLILHGDADQVVPVAEAHELNGCLTTKTRLTVYPGADHRLSDPSVMRSAMAEALEWLTKHVG
ncbi:MAG: alpha/beta fold hydrolase [Deltaproteobacteria bacterium]|nr:alpha/beta fold hydrolase [Deltaproteobacteria bacterium]